jgi:hypothetical protein
VRASDTLADFDLNKAREEGVVVNARLSLHVIVGDTPSKELLPFVNGAVAVRDPVHGVGLLPRSIFAAPPPWLLCWEMAYRAA